MFVFLMSLVLYIDITKQEHTNAYYMSRAKSALYANRVVNSMAFNFESYWSACRGHDEYAPQSGECEDWLGLGITAIDSIDTLFLMGLTKQYNMVRQWLSTISLDRLFQPSVTEINVFETVIRALGGLNSAYALSGDRLWLERARELGDLLLPAFNTVSGCPEMYFNPVSRKGHGPEHLMHNTTGTADVGTLQLEFRTLSSFTGNAKYSQAVDHCQSILVSRVPQNEVVPSMFNLLHQRFMGSTQTIGSSVDSFVEMLLKTWVAFGKRDDLLRITFEKQVDSVLTNLTRLENGTYIVSERESFRRGKPDATMEHLSCFFPGTLAFAALHDLGGGLNGKYMEWARRLARTCFEMTRSTPEGLAPEISYVAVDGSMQPTVETSLIRPEIVESLYVLHAVTGEQIWRRMGQVMWDSIEKNATLPNGKLVSIRNLGYTNVQGFGKLHSFVLAETLKYFYLLFSDRQIVNLSEMVFNTEAHPVPIHAHPPGEPMLNAHL